MEWGVWILLALLLLLLTSIFICYQWINRVSKPYIYHSVQKLPDQDTILLLGTAKLTKTGDVNLFFSYRVEKVATVYQLKNIKRIIVSGADNIPHHGNQVRDMSQYLLEQGVSHKALTKDIHGFRTWVSIWRCKNVYKISSPLIVSQKFHNQRAVFIALKMGMHPSAVNAEMVKGKAGIMIILREALARVKCIMDCYLLKPIPKKTL